ncbi:hypothetical protein ANASTE_01011 [Anaerofustis stercorihominis DSM 17244]|uniref:Uncharacterized protein n=1 Tax=Anaerofustis stercorihominis DSM 17244 TaxID=445971 RepID=B1C8F4_9FIRM|nr:hypothetical protein ANASTE_01011 [Anaerofustis stercorihominis DSM 17244]
MPKAKHHAVEEFFSKFFFFGKNFAGYKGRSPLNVCFLKKKGKNNEQHNHRQYNIIHCGSFYDIELYSKRQKQSVHASVF